MGVQVIPSAPVSFTSRANSAGSWISASVAIITVFPLHSGTNSSTTDTSKEKEARARFTRPGDA